MPKLLKNPTYRNDDGYNGLDLSHVVGFSSSVGHVLPIMWDILQPGDKVRINCALKTRTMPLVSSAFGRITEHVRYFFVPFSQIFKPFEQTFNGIQDFGSDFYQTVIDSNRINNLIPSCPVGTMCTWIAPMNSINPAKAAQAWRLMECLGVPLQEIFSNSVITSEDVSWKAHSINLLPFLAYHKIWFDYMRDTDRIPNDPSYYNMDRFVDTNFTPDFSDPTGLLAKLLTLHNAPVSKDCMNNIFVSPLFGESGVGGDNKDTLRAVQQWLGGAGVQSANQLAADSVTPTTTRPSISVFSGLNTANLRSAFAVEKLLEITRRAKKHYDAQIMAHFGVKVPMGVDGEAIELGHHTQEIQIGDIISSADTTGIGGSSDTGQPLGEVGGKGYGFKSSSKSTFTASTHGILMAIYYAVPDYLYLQEGFDKKLLYNRVADFPRQEFEDLGMQPVFTYNRRVTDSATANSSVLGWQYRYQEVKSLPSRAILGLSRTLSHWCLLRDSVYHSADSFYVSPTSINDILDVHFQDKLDMVTSTPDDFVDANDVAFNSDPLIHQLAFTYKKASKLSTYGISHL